MSILVNPEETIYERIRKSGKPVFVYGMGNGAEKIITVLKKEKISISGVFASDGFVRGQSFLGYTVTRLCDIVEKFTDKIVICVAFGTHEQAVMSRLYELSKSFELYAPDVPVVGDGIFDYRFYTDNLHRIDRVLARLDSDLSREVFCEIIRARLTGEISGFPQITSESKDDISFLLRPAPEDVFLDLGAYDGDTYREYSALCGGLSHSVLVEPDIKNFKKLCANTAGDSTITAVRCAAWSENCTLSFSNRAGRSSLVTSDGAQSVQARCGDDIMRDAGLVPNIIKLDVEGAECSALAGLRETVTRFRPRMCICAYHRTDDMLTIPELILSMRDDYRIAFRKHPYIPAWETVFYAY